MEKTGKEISEAYFDNLFDGTTEKVSDGFETTNIKQLIVTMQAYKDEIDDILKKRKEPTELDSVDWGNIAYFCEAIYSIALSMKVHKEQLEQKNEHKVTR